MQKKKHKKTTWQDVAQLIKEKHAPSPSRLRQGFVSQGLRRTGAPKEIKKPETEKVPGLSAEALAQAGQMSLF